MNLTYNPDGIWEILRNIDKTADKSLQVISLDEMEYPLLMISNFARGLFFSPECLTAYAPPKYLMRLRANEVLISCIQIKEQTGFIQLISSCDKEYFYPLNKLRLGAPGTQGRVLAQLENYETIINVECKD